MAIQICVKMTEPSAELAALKNPLLSPTRPSIHAAGPSMGLSTRRQISEVTSTPSTTGMKMTARKKPRPLTRSLLSVRAISSATAFWMTVTATQKTTVFFITSIRSRVLCCTKNSR